MIKVKNAKGEELEIEESEALATVQAEYENKLNQKDKDIETLKAKHEEEKEKLRQEHIKQIRTLLTGRKENIEKAEFEDVEETDEEKMLATAKNYIKKL